MFFFAGLVCFYLLLWGLQLLGVNGLDTHHKGLYAAAIMFILVGVAHFVKRQRLEAMIPPPLNRHARLLNYGSGVLEIILGVALFFPQWQQPAAWALMVLLVLMFPANVYESRLHPGFSKTFRLFFQPLYIAWLWFFGVYMG
jgi:uncharacterized membrane protein